MLIKAMKEGNTIKTKPALINMRENLNREARIREVARKREHQRRSQEEKLRL